MSIIKISLFCLLLILITALQSITAYIYFSELFSFRFGKRSFFGITFIYMLITKTLSSGFLTRLILLLIFLFVLTTVALFGSIEKKIYHVLSFTFSFTLCELTFSILNGVKMMNVQTEYLRGIAAYFFVNILFLLFIIAIIKILMHFREKNGEGLTDKEYLWLSIIPMASLIIIYASANIPYIPKIINCICLILINLSYLIIYNRITKKNYEIQRFTVIEEQNNYYQERIKNQQEIVKMRHDLKNILITLDSLILKKDVRAVKEQINELLETKAFCYDELTGCVAIDSILNVKLQKIKENSIDYTIHLQIPSDLKMKDNWMLEISAILGNLLDNAIEAVLRLEKNKKIDISLQYDNDKLIFNLQNTSHKLSTNFSDVLIKSEKGKERYGIGISSIKERVNRLKGYYDFRYEDERYTALIVLPIENS